ncbi:hypothetical protein VTN96DRAFT_8554 [Rasamsonia emersonii]|uniref:DUF2264 domain-containing protein n=1 Tax=Rasamsonia emersonii (strain ATCC 16479 / CBS 393.64 / IMI 116815) TaxID=1408163 RepID=A0A0F4YQU7_RASE3|nr:hypothetical protein T310_5775 [Rasamsonia emersonii CBS 393.64]KKA20206.1 hypothetical protein T310_5775 [Rasamsonia emersonii CBS 393.64]
MIDSSKIPPSKLNPLAGNPLRTRDDVIVAVHSLFNPLLPAFSPGKARVQLDASGSTWDRAACDLEGFARPLFGLAPLAAGGSQFDHWELYRTGLKNGTDPAHPEYWGEVLDMDQRHVEATALGYALLFVPEHIWEPLDETAKMNVAAWLLQSRNTRHANNNHKFFRIIVDLGLERVGVPVDESMTEEYLRDLESLYIGDGWYRDGGDKGDTRRIDYYNPFAMHYYGLIYAVHRPRDKARGDRFRERARLFARHFLHWFADSGANVPYGRSLIYRHAVAAFWGALAVANEEALPWGVMKGLYLRNLRWWASQPISRLDDGLLTLGYAYPNQLLTERYSSTGSPWWAMKAFAPLSLPADHPFWTAEELPMPERDAVYTDPIVGMVFMHQPDHTVMLVSGPGTPQLMRGIPEKYNKFAYSSRYGFSVESDALGFSIGAFDSMIALSDDGRHYRVREHCDTAILAGDVLFSRWRPWDDVQIETWLVPSGLWHIRVHRILSARRLSTIEGGFAAPRTDFARDEISTESASAQVISTLGDFSGIVDASTPRRSARVIAPHGNTNVMFPRTFVPQLLGDVQANTPTVFACAVLAGPASAVRTASSSPPTVPAVDQLEKLLEKGTVVEITKEYVPK